MTTMTSTTGIAGLTLSQRFATGLAALVIGMFLVVGVGFSSDMAVHNGAHDTRHATGFPCH